MEAKAVAKGVRVPPSKARLVLDLVRGKNVVEADAILRNLNNKAARITHKVLTSAVANAENNYEMKKENLFISHIVADEGMVLKRIRAGAKGQAKRINKRTSHITVVVSEKV